VSNPGRTLDHSRANADIHSTTMRRLLLFRHAKAERSEPGMEDRGRKLIERGRTDAGRIGAYMASHALLPDRVMVSPSERTLETWKLAAAAIRKAPAGTSVEQLYGATPNAILGVIKDAPASAHSLLIVGHNPGLHELALMLVASGDSEMREHLREKLPTSGLVIIDFAFDNWIRVHPKSGRLERFVSPKSLGAMGG
jgi:phosphohistidine phosphatase